MASAPNDDVGHCAQCDEPAANPCSGCEEPTENTVGYAKTLYCSPLCQMIHWDVHKLHCRKLKSQERLQKGAEVLRRFWHIFRASTFVSKLDKVTKAPNGKITVWETRDDELPQPFNHECFAKNKARDAVLSDRASGEAIDYMRRLAHLILVDSGTCIRANTKDLT
jgi:hypothetical protein